MITIDLSKQQTLDADPKVTQQINFTLSLDRSTKKYNNLSLLKKQEKLLWNFHSKL